ncbi:MAG: hypothetical protein JSR77_16110 [Planctomycetes bacterium]|nr:hypothetical protein [Planctomycetota bacterium]
MLDAASHFGDLVVRIVVYADEDTGAPFNVRELRPEQWGLHQWSGGWARRAALDDNLLAISPLPLESRARRTETTWESPFSRIVEGDPPIVHLESKFPKPWGWYYDDNAHGDCGWVAYRGDEKGRMRYHDLATVAWREVSRVSLRGRAGEWLDRTKLLVKADESELWALFMAALVWEGLGPAAVQAKRTTWGGGAANFAFGTDDLPKVCEKFRSEIAKNKAVIDPVGVLACPVPKTWRHFESWLTPGLFQASAEMLAWLATQASPYPNDLIDHKQAGRIAGVTAKAIRGWIDRGPEGLPCYGPLRRVSAAELKARIPTLKKRNLRKKGRT